MIRTLLGHEPSTCARHFAKRRATEISTGGMNMRRRGVGVLALVAVMVSIMPAGAAMTTEERLRALENLVRQQQEEIEQLRGELGQQKAIGNATQQQAERAEEQAKTTEKKAIASLPEWVNKFTPFGDIRIRQEGFYDQPRKKDG